MIIRKCNNYPESPKFRSLRTPLSAFRLLILLLGIQQIEYFFGDIEAVVGQQDLTSSGIGEDIIIADLAGQGLELGFYIGIEVIKGLFLVFAEGFAQAGFFVFQFLGARAQQT